MATLLDYALTTVQDVKENLDISSGDSQYDNLIIRRINQATEMIERFCGRRFKLTSYTNEEYDASTTDQLILRQRPIVSLTSVGARDTSQNENDWTNFEAEDFFYDSGAGIVKANFGFSGHWNRYRVSYSAGYTDIPADLAEACATLAAFLTENGPGSTSIKRKQEGQREVEYFDQGANTSPDTTIFAQLGILGTLNAYANYPISER